MGLLILVVFFELLIIFRSSSFNFPLDINQIEFDLGTDMLLERKLMKMSDEEKIGTLFIIGFNGTALNQDTQRFINSHHFRHFLLLSKNIQSESQLKSLTSSLNLENSGHFPSRIFIDQEGGRVSRIKFGSIDQISQSEIADAGIAYTLAKQRGEILLGLEISANFSPVVEIIRDKNSYLNADQRAFRPDNGYDDPLYEEKVFQLSAAMIQGYKDGGVISVVKHFPCGLGRQTDDPHQTLPFIDISRTELDQDLKPLKRLIQTKNPGAIMTTHLFYPQIDSQDPVTTSERFISSILRGDLGYQGVIITDDLAMKAISTEQKISSAAKKAFLSGHDLILISGPTQVQAEAYQTILQAFNQGEIPQKRLHASLKRILKL